MNIASRYGVFLVFLLSLPSLASAHGDEGHVTDGPQLSSSIEDAADSTLGDLRHVGFDVTDSVRVEVDRLAHGISLEVAVLIGDRNATEPHEWYIIHAGQTLAAADHLGRTLNVTQNGTMWAVERAAPSAGDCVVVVAHTWHRIDGQKVVLDRVPDDGLAAWGVGDRCHVQGGEPVAVAGPDQKKIPAGLVAPIAAIGATLWMRRR